MCVIKSNDQKEYGASIFKWFTSPKIISAYFLHRVPPVTIEAFDEIMSNGSIILGMKILISCCTPPE